MRDLVKKLAQLQELAKQSLKLWDTPKDADLELLNISENTTWLVKSKGWLVKSKGWLVKNKGWLVKDKGYKRVLRLHRQGYHNKISINCELLWSEALRTSGIILTPKAIRGLDGNLLQKQLFADKEFFLVMFEFIDGHHIDASEDLAEHFATLGNIAARMHKHSRSWRLPSGFERLSWNLETVFGKNPIWGNWRDAPNINASNKKILQKSETLICKKLRQFGSTKERYGLSHADMRLANLLFKDSQVWVIDFDDCGFSWFLYDFATGISFIEDDPQVSACKQAWIEGYNKILVLSREEEDIIDTLVMFRRLALLAWIGSHHKEATEAKLLAPNFADVSATLAEKFLQQEG